MQKIIETDVELSSSERVFVKAQVTDTVSVRLIECVTSEDGYNLAPFYPTEAELTQIKRQVLIDAMDQEMEDE